MQRRHAFVNHRALSGYQVALAHFFPRMNEPGPVAPSWFETRSEIVSKIETENCYTIRVQSWTGDRDEVHLEPPKLVVRNIDPRSAVIVAKCSLKIRQQKNITNGKICLILNIDLPKIDESEIQNHEISLVQHFYTGAKTKLDSGSELGTGSKAFWLEWTSSTRSECDFLDMPFSFHKGEKDLPKLENASVLLATPPRGRGRRPVCWSPADCNFPYFGDLSTLLAPTLSVIASPLNSDWCDVLASGVKKASDAIENFLRILYSQWFDVASRDARISHIIQLVIDLSGRMVELMLAEPEAFTDSAYNNQKMMWLEKLENEVGVKGNLLWADKDIRRAVNTECLFRRSRELQVAQTRSQLEAQRRMPGRYFPSPGKRRNAIKGEITFRLESDEERDIHVARECCRDIGDALNSGVLRANEGRVRWIWSSTGMHGRWKREIPEKTHRSAASFDTIPLCENQHASTSESRGILPGNFRTRPKWPLVAAGSHHYLVHGRHQLGPPTKANRVQSSAGTLLDFRKRESFRTMPFVGGFSQRSQVPPGLHSAAAPLSPHFTLIGSQDLDIKSSSTFSTQLHFICQCHYEIREPAQQYWQKCLPASRRVRRKTGQLSHGSDSYLRLLRQHQGIHAAVGEDEDLQEGSHPILIHQTLRRSWVST
ncbi:hypothetical protein PR048_017804 [Dryococelus australis]|uniref:Uncharacterized protein n=1 Tax=Dryococelus australis TaxID=614101 RepID=A0ABQ9HAG8_9NEOP|nr:hypothetical protein PR048_017804 [Dryococelus australis]